MLLLSFSLMGLKTLFLNPRKLNNYKLASEVKNVLEKNSSINHPVLSYAWHVEKERKSLFISVSNKQPHK